MTTPAQAGPVPPPSPHPTHATGAPATSLAPDVSPVAAASTAPAAAVGVGVARGIMGRVPERSEHVPDPTRSGAAPGAAMSGDPMSGDPMSGDDVLDHLAAAWADDEMWRTVFEQAPIALSLVSPTGRQLAGNAAYRSFLGYGAEESATLDVTRMTRDADQAWTRAYLARLVAGDLERYSTEKVYVRKDGSEVRARLDTTAIRRDGHCVALLGAITPVVERRPMGEGMLRKLIENIHDTISLVDADGRLIETTGRYRPIMGYPSEFWETRSIFDVLADGEVERVMAMREAVLERPGGTVSGAFSVVSADNGLQVLEVHAVNLLDDPDIAGIVITSRNITEHRTLVEDLRASRDDAVAEAELRSRMLATVSHELRNPLHAVQGISELLANSVLPDAERAMAGTINRQVRDLTRVVDDLLTSSRLELDSVSLEREPVDLRALLGDVVAIARTVAAPGVDVHAFVDESIPASVHTDPVRLRQVMSNLVGNAVKFTTTGRVRVLACVERGDVLVLEVSDSGSGIPAEELEAVFEPFHSASTAGRAAGAGLGLSIVRRIVALLGGSVGVTSTVGVGSTFRIELPLDAVEPPARADDQVTAPVAPFAPVVPVTTPSAHAPVVTATTAVAGTAADPEPATGSGDACTAQPVGPAVLVVEDNAVNQQLARAQLKSLGYDCVIAGSGEEGLAYLASAGGAAIEVVLMDYHLPGIDGLETTRRIRAMEAAQGEEAAQAHVAIVGVTASASLADRESCVAAGMDDYVPKPVSLGDLSAAFGRIAPIREAVRAHRASASTNSTTVESRAGGAPWSSRGTGTGTADPADTSDTGAAAIDQPDVTPSVEPDDCLLDVATLVALADELGDRTTVVDLVATFLDELDGRLDAIVAARAAGDGPLLRRLVHTITSSARLLGAGVLAERCATFEQRRLDEASLRAAGRSVRAQLERWAA